MGVVLGLLCQVIAMLLLFGTGPVRAYEEVAVSARPGVAQKVFLWMTKGATRNLVLFTGGGGGFGGMDKNFVLRIAGALSASGFNLAAPERPSDQSGGMSPAFRISAEHAADIAAVIDALQARDQHPVWLVATSNGTVSAARVAARLGPQRVAGLVLTSSVWPRLRALVDLSEISVPTLVIHNRDDECGGSPYLGAESGMAALSGAPIRALITVSGGRRHSGPCQALSRHGFLGIEDQVVGPMQSWIMAH